MNMFQIVMLDLKSIVCAGFGCIMHLQAMAEEVCHIDHSMMFNYNNIFLLQVTIKALICLVDKKTGEKTKGLRFVKQDQIAIVRWDIKDYNISMMKLDTCDPLIQNALSSWTGSLKVFILTKSK